MIKKFATVAVAATLLGTGASAATLDWRAFDQSQVASATSYRDARDTDHVVAFEDFESYTPVPDGGGPGDVTPLTSTSVGDFTTTPGGRCGRSCDTPDDQSLIRNTSNYGRYNTTFGGSNWLDSNDNSAINLAAAGGSMFDSISFFLTDVDDVGRVAFEINVAGEMFDVAEDILRSSRQGDGDLFLVRIGLDRLVSSVDLSLFLDSGDGFGIDDVRLGSSVAPIPVPASLPLLAGGLGLMGWIARRRRKS
ncbi:PEP-CTERM sorting domain-containing protein [Sedimentitalea todarodis]|uniref:PEP-CTERM sorting domain-containing protein n=1 Tax=Sedimentitalea todarodis TaxID=1631240 RepID=A0ABU3VI33_9RHOB|nr:PEP-CTERM sorting domain-containing protein [Sedimentitalea todarodis]MDU9005839.1 PEP-CTERM sorting domain-containing protein [Sedimentitalea todarodis]